MRARCLQFGQDDEARRVAHVVSFGLVGEAKHGDPLSGDRAAAGGDDLRRHRRFSLVVDVDQRLDEPDRRFGLGGELRQSERILGEARTAETRPGIEELAADTVVETDAVGDVENIGAETLAQVSDFVDEGYLHRQEHVGGVFDHLRAAARRIDDPPAVAFDGPIDLPHDLARAVVLDPDDHSVGPLEVLDRRAFAQEFWV